MLPFPLPLLEEQKYFSLRLLLGLGQAPRGKPHNIVPPYTPWLYPSGVLNSQSCPHWASNNLSIRVLVFLPWHWLSMWFSLHWFHCSGKFQLPLFAYLCLQSQWFAPCPSLSFGPKKSCLFFVLFSFLLAIRVKQLPNFLYVESEAIISGKYRRYIFMGLLVFTIIFPILKLDLLNIDAIHS